MKLEDIQSEWKRDSSIDDMRLDLEALKIPKLHSKYYDILLVEKKRQHALKEELRKLEHLLIQFFEKSLTHKEMEEYGLEYPDKKILKPDIPRHIAAHEDVVKLNLRIALQADKVDFLKSVLQTINGRSFQIRDAIEWKKFVAGG